MNMLHFLNAQISSPTIYLNLQYMSLRLTRFKSYVAIVLVSTELEHRPHTLASYLYFYQHKGKRWLELSPGFAGSCVLSSLSPFH